MENYTKHKLVFTERTKEIIGKLFSFEKYQLKDYITLISSSLIILIILGYIFRIGFYLDVEYISDITQLIIPFKKIDLFISGIQVIFALFWMSGAIIIHSRCKKNELHFTVSIFAILTIYTFFFIFFRLLFNSTNYNFFSNYLFFILMPLSFLLIIRFYLNETTNIIKIISLTLTTVIVIVLTLIMKISIDKNKIVLNIIVQLSFLVLPSILDSFIFYIYNKTKKNKNSNTNYETTIKDETLTSDNAKQIKIKVQTDIVTIIIFISTVYFLLNFVLVLHSTGSAVCQLCCRD